MTDAGIPSATWQTATIAEIRTQTPGIKSFFFELGHRFLHHRAGQHVDVRLTAPDGYVAMRSYSIASAPDLSDIIELAIERLPDGEVSSFFHDIAETGDEIEIRGPLGGHFLWPEIPDGPVLLIGAGSGAAPLAAMARHRRDLADPVPTAFLLSSRTNDDILFAEELFALERGDPSFHLALALTRDVAPRPSDFARRIDAAMVAATIARLPAPPAHIFICGSNGFVNVAADGGQSAGIDPALIKTERYGG